MVSHRTSSIGNRGYCAYFLCDWYTSVAEDNSLFTKRVRSLDEVFVLCNNHLFGKNFKKNTPNSRAEIINKISDRAEKIYEKIDKMAEKFSEKKRTSFRVVLLAYGLVIFFIAFPGWLENHISEEYMPFFSVVKDKYQNLEMHTLEVAKEYPPLFKKREEAVLEELESDSQIQKETQQQAKETEEIWLSLSESGKYGSNVRKKPSASSEIITAISEDDKVRFIKKKDGWVKVCLKSGEKGWMKESLLEGVPENE